MVSKAKGAALLVAAGVAVLGIFAGTQIGSSTTASSGDATTIVLMRDAQPMPVPAFGARVTLKGCSQVVGVTLKRSSVGLVIQSGDAPHWVTKVERVSGVGPAPPIFKGPMQPGVWIKISKFTNPIKFNVYYASKSCPGMTLAYKWNASKVLVTVG